MRRLLLALALTVGLVGGVANVHAAPLPLSDEGAAWLREHPTLRVGYDAEWAPFTFREKNADRPTGTDVALIEACARRLGVTVDFVTRPTWAEVESLAREREVDILLSVPVTEARRKYLVFTEAYASTPFVIVMRDDAAFAHTLEALGHGPKRYVVAAPRAYMVSELLARPEYGLNLLDVPSSRAALEAVLRGDADATVSLLPNASFHIKNEGWTSLKLAGVLDERFDARFAVRSDWPELQRVLDAALVDIPRAERSAIVAEWIGVDATEDVLRRRVVWEWGLSAVLFATLILGAVLLVNRRLRKEITAREAMEVSLREVTRIAVAATESKSALMRAAVHDVRTPLMVLGMEATILAREATDAQTLESLSSMRQVLKRLGDLMSVLIDVDALEAGRRQFHAERLDLSLVLAGLRAELALLARGKSIDLQWSLDPLAVIHADPTAMTQVVANLVGNAIKFTPRDGVVWIRVTAGPEVMTLVVEDSGPGIPAEELPKLFSQFGRLSPRPTADEPSTGLGLWLVKQLLSSAGASIRYEPREGGGSRFVVEWPRAAE